MLPVWAELLEVFSIFQDAVNIVPSSSNLSSPYVMHISVLNCLHANLEVMIFALICCKDKGTNPTCLV
jgi:hypothetical protein